MMVVGNHFREIECGGYFDSVIKFLFAELAIWETFDL